MKLNKSQIIKVIVKQTELPKKQVTAVLNEFLSTIREIVSSGDSFNWRTFGTFFLKERKPRKVRNFTTGESRVVVLSPVPAFKPSKSLLDAVGKSRGPSIECQGQEMFMTLRELKEKYKGIIMG